jgi:hypothetical protein
MRSALGGTSRACGTDTTSPSTACSARRVCAAASRQMFAADPRWVSLLEHRSAMRDNHGIAPMWRNTLRAHEVLVTRGSPGSQLFASLQWPHRMGRSLATGERRRRGTGAARCSPASQQWVALAVRAVVPRARWAAWRGEPAASSVGTPRPVACGRGRSRWDDCLHPPRPPRGPRVPLAHAGGG